MNKNEMGPKDFSHKFHKYEQLLSLILAVASHSETRLWHCLSRRFELHLYPIPFESLKLSLRHDMKISLSIYQKNIETNKEEEEEAINKNIHNLRAAIVEEIENVNDWKITWITWWSLCFEERQ